MIYVIESKMGDWDLDYNLPHEYLVEGVADYFDQAFGFFFNGLEDAEKYLNMISVDYPKIQFRLRECTITTRELT